EENLRAVRGDAEVKAVTAIEFALSNHFARGYVEGPELAAVVPGIAGDGDGVANFAVRREIERQHVCAVDRADWGKTEGELGKVNGANAENFAMHIRIGRSKDTGDLVRQFVGIFEDAD